MNILVIGLNGREHALAASYAKSKRVKKVVLTPGNGLTDFDPSNFSGQGKINNYPDVAMKDFDGIVDVCKKEKIDLVDIAQDDVIASGYVDRFEKLGIATFGPTQKASQLEWDKQWARDFMLKYKLPIPQYESFTSQEDGISYVQSLPEQILFIKAAGLALGKGVIRGETKEEAIAAIKSMSQFGKAGETFLVEEALIGEEFSLFALCDGENYQIVNWAQDHKRVFDGDRGPNTGGVGSVAPAAVVNQKILKEVETKILTPVIEGMKKEGRPYKGVLYLGAMSTRQGVKIIEFNCRWGDPEAEVILPGIKTDYVTVAEAVRNGKLASLKIDLDKKVRLSIAGCSRGYPGDYSKVKGKEIFGIAQAMKLPGIKIFGAGIKREGTRFFANGGRIFHLVGEGDTIVQARERAYGAMVMVRIEEDNLHYRTDIGWRDMVRIKR